MTELRWNVAASCVLALATLLAGCERGAAESPSASDATAAGSEAPAGMTVTEALPVEIETLRRGSIESTLSASANLEAESAVEVYARTEGLVKELYVEEGNSVRREDVLLKLEDQDQRNNFDSVQAQLQKARREYQRQRTLFQQKLISEQVFNESTYEIEQLELKLDDARRMLEQTEVRAPIAGRVTARLVTPGARVQPGVHLFDIVDFNSLVARIYVPEKELSRLRPGLGARVRSQALPGRRYSGRLVRVAPVIDARSGTVKATIAIGSQPGLLPGMYVDVALVTDTHADTLLVPKRALAYDGEQAFVYKLSEDDRVERVRIVPELTDEEFVKPRAGDIAAGDRVVVAGQAALKDGARVRVIEAPAPAGGGSR